MDFGDVHTPTGATSTSDPHHEVDPEVDPRKANPHRALTAPATPGRSLTPWSVAFRPWPTWSAGRSRSVIPRTASRPSAN